LGPPPSFEVPRLALLPEINVQTHPQSLFFSS